MIACAVCGGLIVDGVRYVYVGTVAIPLCEADFYLGTEVTKALDTEEVAVLVASRANPGFNGSAEEAIRTYIKAHSN